MKKRNSLIIIYLRFIFSFVYFLSAIFPKKERDKKAAGRLRGSYPFAPRRQTTRNNTSNYVKSA